MSLNPSGPILAAQTKAAALAKISRALQYPIAVTISTDADIKNLVAAIKASRTSNITINIRELPKPVKPPKKA